MEVVNEREQIILNSEVYSFITEAHKHDSSTMKRYGKEVQNLYTIDKELLMYLDKTPSLHVDMDQLTELAEKTTPFNLYKMEILMIVNNHPKNLAELTPMIEQIDARLSAEDQEDLVNIINSIFPDQEEMQN